MKNSQRSIPFLLVVLVSCLVGVSAQTKPSADLMRRGVPERNLIAETLGTDTAHSAERLGVIMRANGMKSCLAVSDEYHVFRIKKLLEHEGMTVYVAPRTGSRPKGAFQRMLAVLREAMSYLAWKVS
jgi:uncharacterized SAM-binding protein YcdF (DUF218 family)